MSDHRPRAGMSIHDPLPNYFDPQPRIPPRRPRSLILPVIVALAVMLAGFALGAVIVVGVFR